MKKVIFLLVIFLIAQNAISQSLIAVQNGGTPSFYSDLGNAIDNAVDGDTIYIPGRSYTLSKTINKRLHLVGTGINPNSTNATGVTMLSTATTGVPQLTYEDGADGGSVTGIHFTASSTYENILVTDVSGLSDFLINRCYFGNSITGVLNNSTLKQNIFKRFIDLSGGSNVLISNNIFQRFDNIFEDAIVSNNIFLSGININNIAIEEANDCIIENNFLPNTWAIGTVTSCLIRNNLNVANGTNSSNIIYGNFNDDVDLINVFENYSGDGFDTVYYTENFNLPDTSPYKNAGADGTDIGIYGGRFPWKDGEAPFNPQIIFKDIEGNTDENGNIQVEIHVEAQGN